MFYSEAILSRRGPLGKVWLAAHMERKLSKTQTLQTNIEESVGAIMGQEVEVMALRLSGQLLLGVVRIYSRKAKYLLDDCNEALLKIKMAFRPGVVDMTEDQLAVNKNAITLQGGDLDIDLLLPDMNWELDFEDRPLQHHGQHEARMADITLATADDFTLNADDFDLSNGFDLGPSDGIGSQDFGDIDIGIDWGDGVDATEAAKRGEENQESMSIEMGRDATSHRESIGSHILGRNGIDRDMDILSNRSKSREASEHPFGADMDLDLPDLGGVDLGDFGIGFDDQLPGDREKTPGQARSSRASSPLSSVPATPPPEEPITPQATIKAKRKIKEKKQIIDIVTELQDGPGARIGRGRNGGLGAPVVQDVSDIVTEQRFLPRSAVVMRLLEIRSDPLSHFLPTKVTPNGTFFCAAPPGMAPELAELFMRPVSNLTSRKRGASPDKSPNKKARLSAKGDDGIELGRRAGSVAPSVAFGSDVLGRASVGPDGGIMFPDETAGLDDFQMDVPDMDADGVGMNIDQRARSKSTSLTDLSRLSTPAPEGRPVDEEDSYADASCPIAMFDVRPSMQSQSTEDVEPTGSEGKGYSKNTVKALSIIRRELKSVAEQSERVMSFRQISHKASRRAAASFFFELLVLGTRDCVKLSQSAPFENIEVQAKDKLWERQRHDPGPSRFTSVVLDSTAPSRPGSMVPLSRAPSVTRSATSTLGL